MAAVLSPLLPGRWRALRLLWVAIIYLTFETLLLAVLLGLWLASGFGWKIRSPYFAGIHYELVQGTLVGLLPRGQAGARPADPHRRPTPDARPERPVLVLSPRGAGQLVHPDVRPAALVPPRAPGRAQEHPRLGPRDRRDPRRIPAKFISPNPAAGEDLESQIAALATGLDANDAFVIFPEGGNFTPARRDRAIARLRKLGLEKMAVRAEEMTHVLAPRPGGVLAALDGAPDADVADGRPHRARPPGHRQRRVARAADGQADHHALVGGAALGDPRRS